MPYDDRRNLHGQIHMAKACGKWDAIMTSWEGAQPEYGVGSCESFLIAEQPKVGDEGEFNPWNSTMALRHVKRQILKSQKHSSNISVTWIGDLNSQKGDIVINAVAEIIWADEFGSS